MPQQDEHLLPEELDETEGASASWEGAPFVAEDPSLARARERAQALERQTRAVSLGPAIVSAVDPVLESVERSVPPALSAIRSTHRDLYDNAPGVSSPLQHLGQAAGQSAKWLWNTGTDLYNQAQEQEDLVRQDHLAYVRGGYDYQRTFEDALQRAGAMDSPPLPTYGAEDARGEVTTTGWRALPRKWIGAYNRANPPTQREDPSYAQRLAREEAIEHVVDTWAARYHELMGGPRGRVGELYATIRDESLPEETREEAWRTLEDLWQHMRGPE